MAKSMPYSLEAEQSVLGCILIDQLVQIDIISELTEEDFLVESHKIIFDKMREIYYKNQPVDLVTLSDLLQKSGQLSAVGGISYITELARTVPSSANYSMYLDIVKRDSVLRRLITSSNLIIEDCTSSTDGEKSLSFAEKLIFDVSARSEKSGLERVGNFFDAVLEKFEKIERDKNYAIGLKTGFTRLDYLTNGLQKGNLIILAARPSVGKTTLAMNLVENIAIRENATIAVFELEMTKVDIAQRMICSVSDVKMDDALKGKLTQNNPNSFKKLWETKKLLKDTNIFVDQSSGVTPQEILSKCRRLKMRHGLDLIVVDHIQLMNSAKKNIESRQQEVTDISKNLKMIAKELDVPVIALSQLSRLVTGRKGGRPVLSDLRESGAIEQDADLVLFIHRPDKDTPDNKVKDTQPNLTEIIVAKNRNGECGLFNLVFKGESVKFVNYTNYGGQPTAETKADKEGRVRASMEDINGISPPPDDENDGDESFD